MSNKKNRKKKRRKKNRENREREARPPAPARWRTAGDEVESFRALLEQLRAALSAGAVLPALFVAVSIPDICAALDADDGRTSGPRYRTWFRNYFTDSGPRFTEEDCYELRCSLLHQGRSTGGQYARVVLSTNPCHEIDGNLVELDGDGERVLQIDLRLFCERMIESAERWLSGVGSTPRFLENMSRFARFYPNGVAGFISGASFVG